LAHPIYKLISIPDKKISNFFTTETLISREHSRRNAFLEVFEAEDLRENFYRIKQ